MLLLPLLSKSPKFTCQGLFDTSRQKLKQVTLLTLLLLTMLLSSCSSDPQIVTCPSVPPVLLGHLDRTAFAGNTYGDVTQYAVILKRERDVCLNRVDKIREWRIENAQR